MLDVRFLRIAWQSASIAYAKATAGRTLAGLAVATIALFSALWPAAAAGPSGADAVSDHAGIAVPLPDLSSASPFLAGAAKSLSWKLRLKSCRTKACWYLKKYKLKKHKKKLRKHYKKKFHFKSKKKLKTSASYRKYASGTIKKAAKPKKLAKRKKKKLYAAKPKRLKNEAQPSSVEVLSTGGSVGGGGGGSGGGGGGWSDIRLKTAIVRLATLDNGLPVYAFSYRWDQRIRHVGVMAQDVIALGRGDVVTKTLSGYYKVDYTALGLRMTTLEDFQAHGLPALLAN